MEMWAYARNNLNIMTPLSAKGWTMLDLFDYTGRIVPGKYKVPFYSMSIHPMKIF